MAKAYVSFQVSPEVVSKTYEALQLAKQSGTVRKGANEVTKSVERGLATFVVIAEDVEPEEVVIHIPKLCEQKKIAYSYVPTKVDLGKAIGMSIPCAAVAVEGQGQAGGAIRDVIVRITGKSGGEQRGGAQPKQQAPQQAKKPEQPKQPQKPKVQPQQKQPEAPKA